MQVFGIYGLSGTGKSTLARAIFNQLYLDFGSRHVAIELEHGMSKRELMVMQSAMLKKLCGVSTAVNDVSEGQQLLCDSLDRRQSKVHAAQRQSPCCSAAVHLQSVPKDSYSLGNKHCRGDIDSALYVRITLRAMFTLNALMQVLILLDNVCNSEQRDALIPGCLRLPPNSVVIMTAASKAVLRHDHEDVLAHCSKLLLLSAPEAVQLVLMWAALPESEQDSVKPVAQACHGVAMMLRMAGCYLKDKPKKCFKVRNCSLQIRLLISNTKS